MSEPMNYDIKSLLEEERDRILTPEGKRMMAEMGQPSSSLETLPSPSPSQEPSALYQRIIEKVREAVDTATDATALAHEVKLLKSALAAARTSVMELMAERETLRFEVTTLKKAMAMLAATTSTAPIPPDEATP